MQHTSAAQDAPTVVGVIDPDPVARSGLRTLLHGLGVDVSTFDSAESYLLSGAKHVGCPGHKSDAALQRGMFD